ncbi:hypothetical protein Tco_0733148 [Tanacetum coccineum]
MSRLVFCDYHNMVANLEKTEHNQDFHQIVDFLRASHIRYALEVRPTIYALHIKQFWSTARTEIINGEAHIIATIDGRQRTITELSIRRSLLLNDEIGIDTLPTTKVFQNLPLMGYNISENQKISFQKGQFTHQWKFLIHTIMQCLSPKSTGFNEFSSNITTAIVCFATQRTYNFSKMILDEMISNIKRKTGKFLMYPRFLAICLNMSEFGAITHKIIYPIPSHTSKVFTTLRVNSPSISGHNIGLFDHMIVQQGDGTEQPPVPHHTPSPPPQIETTNVPHTSLSPVQTLPQITSSILLPSTTPTPTTTSTPTRLTRSAIRIAQSKALRTGADEPASLSRGVRYGEAFTTVSGLDA